MIARGLSQWNLAPQRLGDGDLDNGEECDGAEDPSAPATENSFAVTTSDDPHSADGAMSEPSVFLRDDEDGKRICLRQGENDSNFPEEIEDRFFQFCNSSDGNRRPGTPVRRDSRAEGRGESCRVYLPEPGPKATI